MILAVSGTVLVQKCSRIQFLEHSLVHFLKIKATPLVYPEKMMTAFFYFWKTDVRLCLPKGYKYWPFQVIDESGKPKIRVKSKESWKTFAPEEISSMVLTKMKETVS